ncbi:MAG: hypothetical protein ABF242_06585 [Flavobacteriales bacterium]
MAGKVTYKPLVYPPKILLAWGEAISGNREIRDWLGKNGYPELYTFVFALYLKEDARNWLMKNNYPHLLAMIQGVERNKKALAWLQKNEFEVLYHMALAGDGEEASLKWLVKKHRDFAHIAMKIKKVKDGIQDDHDDPHKMSRS